MVLKPVDQKKHSSVDEKESKERNAYCRNHIALENITAIEEKAKNFRKKQKVIISANFYK